MDNVLGRGWEADQKNGWKDATWEIMRGENWDRLIEIMENTVNMYKLLNDADYIIANSTTNNDVNRLSADTEATEFEESSADRESVSNASDSLSCTIDRKLLPSEDMEPYNDLDPLPLYDDESGPLSVCSAISSYKEENTRPTDKRQNVIVFLPADMECSIQDKEVEKALRYLGCEKHSILNTEMVRDRGEDCNGKIVLRVQMNTVKQASKALANAYKLKNYPVTGIYIAKDMTYHQRIKMRELVRTLRSKIELLPEYRWKIVDWEVVNVGRFKKQEQEYMLDLMDSVSGSLVISSCGSL